MMLGVYQLALSLVGPELAWYVGFWVYWPVWCVLFPLWAVGWGTVRSMFQRGRLTTLGWSLAAFPPTMAFIGRFVFETELQGVWAVTVWVLMAFANGTLEEILWRGVYTRLFPDRKLWAVAWPTLWFALWHAAPGSVSESSVWLLMAGAGVFGACWGYVAMKTGSIRWSVASHILSGIVRL